MDTESVGWRHALVRNRKSPRCVWIVVPIRYLHRKRPPHLLGWPFP